MESKTKWKIISSAVLALVVVGLAIFIAKESSKPENQQARNVAGGSAGSASRVPASIQKVFDFSHLQGGALEFAAKQRLASSINIAREGQDSVVEVGNFVLTNDSNEKDFACGYYDQVDLEFDAEGVAVSGEKPHISVVTGCEVATNINLMEPIHIPVQKLKAGAPSETEYKFYDVKRPMTVVMANAPPEWPGQWVLTDLKLTNSQNPSRVLHIQSADLKATSGQIRMNW